MQLQKIKLNQKNKWPLCLVLFCLFLIFFQVIDRYFWQANQFVLNNQLVFGLVGNNLIALLVFVPLISLFFYGLVKSSPGHSLLYILLISASFSNLSDRFLYGGVIDYINFFHIPTFNLSDFFILSCLGFLLIGLVKNEKTPH